MNKFKSVKITHNILQRIDFSYLAEFFRFIGILVCEEMLTDLQSERTEAEDRTVYSARIYVGKREMQEEEAGKLNLSADEYRNKVEKLLSTSVMLYDCLPPGVACIADLLQDTDTRTVQKQILHNVLDSVLNSVFEPEDVTGFQAVQLQELINVYVENKIWLHSLNMQYYGKKSSNLVTEAEKGFLAAQKEIQKILEQRGDTAVSEQYLYEYALLWCQVKTNSACDCNKEILYFSSTKLPERCRNLYKKYPDFTNALILWGLSYEPLSNCANEAVAVFMDALDEIGEQCFASAVYYWIGKRYEAFSDKRDVANHNYELAYRHKIKFRNIFKLAIADRDKGDIKSALKRFGEIPKKLALKREIGFLDPLELEYLYKVFFQQAYICYKEKDYVRTIEYGIQCKDVWEKDMEESRYFNDFYGAEAASDYRKLLKRRVDVRKIYRILMECYSQVLNENLADNYRKKIQKADMVYSEPLSAIERG